MGRVKSFKNVTEEGLFTHLGMLPKDGRRLLTLVGDIEVWVLPQGF